MILFKETRPATLGDVRWLRKNLGRRLEESCLRIIDPMLNGKQDTLSLIDSIVLAVTEIANSVVEHSVPKPAFLSLEVRLVGTALRVELRNDGGAFDELDAGGVHHYDRLIAGRGPSLVSQGLQDLGYHRGSPNRLVGWRDLRIPRPHILIIEDDPEEARDLQMLLSESYKSSWAQTSTEAEFVLSSQKIDVILARYNLSLQCRAIFEAVFDRYPIRVVLTASGDDFDAMRVCPPAYADQCLEKPVSKSKLIAAIEIAIASNTRRLIHLANFFGRGAGVLLADELPRKVPGFKLEIFSGTATYGGGDFGLALPGNGFTRLVLSDIMGHGLKAKAGAIALSAIVRTLHCQTAVPADALLQTISHTVANEPAFTDIIGTIIIVDAAEDGWIEAASAGHPPVAIISPERSFILPVTGPLPGLLAAPVYQLRGHQMRPGDKMAIITDGIDSQTAATADFPERLLDELSKDPSRSLDLLREDMGHWLERRLGPAPKDDWTLMIGEYCGTPAHERRKRQEAAPHPSLPSS